LFQVVTVLVPWLYGTFGCFQLVAAALWDFRLVTAGYSWLRTGKGLADLLRITYHWRPSSRHV